MYTHFFSFPTSATNVDPTTFLIRAPFTGFGGGSELKCGVNSPSMKLYMCTQPAVSH